jgi:hypothetical protein
VPDLAGEAVEVTAARPSREEMAVCAKADEMWIRV